MKRSKSRKSATSLEGLRSAMKIKSLRETEKEAILTAVKKTRGDKFLASILLGISKTKIYRKLQKYAREAGPQGRKQG
jgi:DNA-binding NtrC family response regulator